MKLALVGSGSQTQLPFAPATIADAAFPVNNIEKTHTSRNTAQEALKNGDVDALSSNAGSWLNERNAETDLPYGFFKMIARSGDLPNDMIMVGAQVSQETAMQVRDAILANKDSIFAGITANEENDKYVGMDFVSIENSAYDYVRQMYSNAGQPQFDNFIGE